MDDIIFVKREDLSPKNRSNVKSEKNIINEPIEEIPENTKNSFAVKLLKSIEKLKLKNALSHISLLVALVRNQKKNYFFFLVLKKEK